MENGGGLHDFRSSLYSETGLNSVCRSRASGHSLRAEPHAAAQVSLSRGAVGANIRSAVAKTLQTLIDADSGRRFRKPSKKLLQLLLNSCCVATSAGGLRQLMQHGFSFLFRAVDIAIWKPALKFQPYPIRFDESHASEAGTTAVIGLLFDVDRPDGFRISRLQCREESSIRFIAPRGGQLCEVIHIRLDKNDFLTIDQQAS